MVAGVLGIVEPLLLHDEEQETPCHPGRGAQSQITFMSLNGHFSGIECMLNNEK